MAKPYDFAERLFAAVAARRARPFKWGENDCALFACDVLLEATGQDFAAPFRGRYKSAVGAARVLKKFAGGGLEETAEAIARDHARPEVPPLKAQRGDMVLVETETGPALGVCLGEAAAVAGQEGTVMVPARSWLRAWRV
ncbi:MAG: hypothetical protein V3S45_01910 [Kiloniellales bacterium]